MKKEELLHLHMLMFLINLYFKDILNDEILTEHYDSLALHPSHIHKDKIAHSDALFILGDEIVSHVNRRKVPVINYPYLTVLPLAAIEN
ncbi:MAG: UPF0058 family protein [Methanoregula sp.]